jgi:hypothetical protein
VFVHIHGDESVRDELFDRLEAFVAHEMQRDAVVEELVVEHVLVEHDAQGERVRGTLGGTHQVRAIAH